MMKGGPRKEVEFETQVDKEHYNQSYDNLNRFLSYFYQLDVLRKLKPRNILEIGVGNKTTSNYLKEQGFNVTTCDFDRTLNPDVVADIRKLPFPDNSFDCVAAFEILEHLPFTEFSKSLAELSRVSRKRVVISIPYSSIYFEFLLRFPFINRIFKKDFLRLFLHVPFFSYKFLSKEHYWELGRKGYPLRRIRARIRKHFKIVKEFRPPVDTYHYFFILSTKK